jgi:hypothetical protein
MTKVYIEIGKVCPLYDIRPSENPKSVRDTHPRSILRAASAEKQHGGDSQLDTNALNRQCDAANRIFAFALHSEASIYVAASCDCRTRVRQD